MDNRLSSKLIGITAVILVLIVAAWVFVKFVAPNIPETRSNLVQSEEAVRLTAVALRKFLPGQDVRIERRFGYNLKLYVDRKPFDDIPFIDRKAIVAELGRLWCGNIGDHWLARVSVVDISSGARLAIHACVFGD
jgi:hypothetical protein